MNSEMIRARQIGMLQVDIFGHSELSKTMAPWALMEAKMALAKGLEHDLRERRFAMVDWAGDGGLFAIECKSVADFDTVVLGGEVAFCVLRDVNRRYSRSFPDGARFSLRVSAHLGSVLTVRDPRFWHGNELNFFVKHERDLSEPNKFSITLQLREMLSREQREKFPEGLAIQKTVAGRDIRLHFHQRVWSSGR
jgi:hypothetical protein